MSEELRIRILLALEKHARTGKATYVADTELAAATGAPVAEIQRQLDILETQGLTTAANTFGGHNAIIAPAGSLVVEDLGDAASQSSKPKIGF